MSDVQTDDLTFVRRDIGLALLGALVANVGVGLGALDQAFFAIAGIAGVWVFVVLWHLGWRLAFPRRMAPGGQDRVMLVVATLGGLVLAGLLAVVAILLLD